MGGGCSLHAGTLNMFCLSSCALPLARTTSFTIFQVGRTTNALSSDFPLSNIVTLTRRSMGIQGAMPLCADPVGAHHVLFTWLSMLGYGAFEHVPGPSIAAIGNMPNTCTHAMHISETNCIFVSRDAQHLTCANDPCVSNVCFYLNLPIRVCDQQHVALAAHAYRSLRLALCSETF